MDEARSSNRRGNLPTRAPGSLRVLAYELRSRNTTLRTGRCCRFGLHVNGDRVGKPASEATPLHGRLHAHPLPIAHDAGENRRLRTWPGREAAWCGLCRIRGRSRRGVARKTRKAAVKQSPGLIATAIYAQTKPSTTNRQVGWQIWDGITAVNTGKPQPQGNEHHFCLHINYSACRATGCGSRHESS